MTGDAARHALPPGLLHELRTPLGQIIGYAELLAERAEEAGDERFAPDLEKIAAAGYRMLALIEDNLTTQRAPQPEFGWEDVDMLRGLPGPHAERLASRIAALLPPRV